MRRIHILRAVRDEIHHHHQEHQINEQLPVRCDSTTKLTPTLVFRFLPDLRLLYLQPHIDGEQCRKAANKEHWSPAPAWKNKEVTRCCQQIAGGVTFLQQS